MPKPVAFKCSNCNAPLSAPTGRGQFYCQFCGASLTIPKPPRSAESESTDPKPLVAIPENLRVEELGRDLRISWRWFRWPIIMLVPFCIAWNSFLVGWYSMAFSGDGPPGAFKLVFLIFPIGHVAVGLGLLYACLVGILNRTTIEIARNEISVRHGPIPAGRNRTIPVGEIIQLYVKREQNLRNKNSPHGSYPLVAQLASGREVKLLPRNSELDVAQAVEQLVESHLNIEDQSVRGEHRD